MNFTELYKKIRSIDEAANAGDDAAYQQYASQRATGDMLNKEIAPEKGISTTVSPQAQAVAQDMTTGLAGQNPEMEKRYTMNKLNTQQQAQDLTGQLEEDGLDECGPMGPNGMMGMRGPEQQDSISANISMNASGKGGIRDLMNILQNLESGSSQEEMPNPKELELDIKGMDHPHDEPKHGHDEEDNIIFGNDMEEEFANEPDEMYAPVSAVTPTGNDMHSKGAERPKVNGGGNPYAVTAEGLQRQLQNLYQEIKSR